MPKKVKEAHSFELANGVRVIHHPLRFTQLVHCGIFIKAGTRDEQPKNNGVAHLIEHAVFKGTKKRKTHQLFNRIESVGGEINAFTTRESTAFYTSSLKRYADRSIDLLSDVCFHPRFDAKELEKEKLVVYEEIEMYNDSPEDSIYDEFYERMFRNHPLGFNILGSRDSLKDLKPADLKSFMNQQYSAERMVLSVSGKISKGRLEQLAEKLVGHEQLTGEKSKREKPAYASPFRERIDKDFAQTHAIVGAPAPDRYDEQRYAFMLLNNILGGYNMGSRLNMSIREKHGIAYHVSSHYSTYDDAGLFQVSLGCDRKNLEKSLALIKKAIRDLRTKSLGPIQLNKAKRQLQGNLAMMTENPSVLMQSNAKSMLVFDKLMSLESVFEKIDAVAAEDVQEMANQYLRDDQLSELVYLNN